MKQITCYALKKIKNPVWNQILSGSSDQVTQVNTLANMMVYF